MIINVFRADRTNAGDWWSPPIRYFKFDGASALDILNVAKLENREGLVIVGGGGLGRPFFAEAIKQLMIPGRRYFVVGWGIGFDTVENRSGVVTEEDERGGYFDDFDLVGSRAVPTRINEEWVPCSSCMWPGFESFRSLPPKHKIGIYEHKRVPIPKSLVPEGCPRLDNSGDSILEKVSFLSSCEIIVTNSYHGVYWATLLNRRVLCLPFKNGLYSFKHRPKYLSAECDLIGLEETTSYPEALEECREANHKFYSKIRERYL